MKIKGPNFKEQETKLYERIRELSDEFDRQNKAGKDTIDIVQRLEKALEEFLLFRQ